MSGIESTEPKGLSLQHWRNAVAPFRHWACFPAFPGYPESSDMAASRPPIPSYVGALAQLNKARGKAAAKKLPRPLVLANHVSNRRLRQGEATCITEMSLMMACWKQNEFSDTACAREIQTFYDCAAKAEAERKEKIRQESIGLTGNLTPKQVNKLLSRFPNITQNS